MSVGPQVLAILSALADQRTRLTAAEIAEAAGLSEPEARRRMTRMLNRGLIARAQRKWRSTPAGRAVLAASRGGLADPARPAIRHRIWRALRRLKKATAHDLATLAADGTERDPLRSARSYLTMLKHAGYVVALPRRHRSHRVTWVLIRDTGPRPPLCDERRGTVRDDNTGEVHQIGSTAHE